MSLISICISSATKHIYEAMEGMSICVSQSDGATVRSLLRTCVDSKLARHTGSVLADVAWDSIWLVGSNQGHVLDLDVNNDIRVEKVVGGGSDDCRLLKGVMFRKDVINPGRMRRRVVNPRIILLDCPLENVGFANVNGLNIGRREDIQTQAIVEEHAVKRICDFVVFLKPDLVVTEKGVCDLANYYFQRKGTSVIRRVRNTDIERVAKAVGAVIVHRPLAISNRDVGIGAGLFEVQRLGEDYFTFIVDCKEPRTCTVVLRGASKDIINETERNFNDALCVARNVFLDPRLTNGGGAVEMYLSIRLRREGRFVCGKGDLAYNSVADSLEVVPRVLANSCGINIAETLVTLRMFHGNIGGHK